jgi:hypothetical protein
MIALVNIMSSYCGSKGKIISKHRNLVNAIKANSKYQKMVKKNNGQNSYIPTDYYTIQSDGSLEEISSGDVFEAQCMVSK